MPSATFAHPILLSILAFGFGAAGSVRSTWATNSVSNSVPLCWSEGPVLDINAEWRAPETEALELLLGPMRLPLAPWRPDVITEARMAWRYSTDGGAASVDSPGKQLTVRLDFPDPKPFGLPYTVQGFAIESPTGTYVQDWSHDCEDPGVSVFPGQSWTENLDLVPQDGGHFHLNEVVRVRIWGSRN